MPDSVSSLPSWSPLTHCLHRWASREGLPKGGAYGVGVSGGRDSVLLLTLLLEVAGAMEWSLSVLHVHHGGAEGGGRDQALEWVRELARSRNIGFHFARADRELVSEEECRDFRRALFEEARRERDLRGIFLAHHRDDLLETRLLRLMRGVGPQGLPAMTERRGAYLRPFLSLSRKDIQAEVDRRNLGFLEDETNALNHYERNWLRNHWLPQLEERRPGSLRNLSRSLELLVEVVASAPTSWPSDLILGPGRLSRPVYLSLSRFEQRRCLATLLRALEKRDYSQGQIEEIQKCLDKSESEHSFQIAGCLWRVDVRQIEAIEVEIRKK